MSDRTNNLTAAGPPAKPADDWVDVKSDADMLDLLGPDWSRMSAAERARYGHSPAEPDPLFTRLEHLGDLDVAIELEIAALLDGVEEHLRAVEARVGLALYRERATRSASHGPQWWQAAP